jgi:hypothetical protein
MARSARDPTAGLQNGQDVLLHRQLAKYRGFLRQVTDPAPGALVHRQRGHIAARKADRAGIGPDQAHHHVEAGRLPSPIRPQQPHDFPFTDMDGNAVHDRASAVRLSQTLGLK